MKARTIFIALCYLAPIKSLQAQEKPNKAEPLRFGSVLALRGAAKDLGNGMKNGLDASLNGKTVNGRKIIIQYMNDSYEPVQAFQATRKLIRSNIFAMIGNVGTPTAKVTLPLLAYDNIPAIGFFTGAGILRPAPGPIVNYRASYVQETAAVINEAVKYGANPDNICAYVQNDAYGMAGLTGIMKAKAELGVDKKQLETLNHIKSLKGNNPKRNNIGPVGVYKRNTNNAMNGYKSLKHWEKQSGKDCRLVITVGAYANISRFVEIANSDNKENWIISAVSFTGADSLSDAIHQFSTPDRIIMTQVVPLLDANIPLVREARHALGPQFGFVSLEGYIVGKLTLAILEATPEPVSREKFMAQARRTKINLGGLPIDFTKNKLQGSNLVITSYLSDRDYKPVTADIWKQWLSNKQKRGG